MTHSARLQMLPLCLALAVAAPSSWAQEAPREVVLPPENVRHDYAQVLAVRPIYQVLRTTSNARVCDEPGSTRTLSRRMVGAVRNRLGADGAQAEGVNCRMEQVPREFRRTIAYDVDYAYKGSKFRTRMARDPGNRLRIRISITPQPAD